jgi:hypothetical protein
MIGFLERVKKLYPGAYALEVVGNKVWVHCHELDWKEGRVLPAGTVGLVTSPESAALAAEILNDAR